MDGWISIHRKICDNWIWADKPYDKARAWIDLLLMVNYEDKKVMFDGQLLAVKKGQRITSIRKLSDRWGWSTKKVKTFLSVLESDNMLTIKSDNKKTLITIENYSFYQPKETQKKHTGNTEEPQKKTNNKDNNNNKYIYEQIEHIWSLYPNKKGKSQAIKKIPKLIQEHGYEKIIQCVEAYANECTGKDKKYIKHGSTFFTSGYVDYLDQEENIRYYYEEDPITGEQIKKRWRG